MIHTVGREPPVWLAFDSAYLELNLGQELGDLANKLPVQVLDVFGKHRPWHEVWAALALAVGRLTEGPSLGKAFHIPAAMLHFCEGLDLLVGEGHQGYLPVGDPSCLTADPVELEPDVVYLEHAGLPHPRI